MNSGEVRRGSQSSVNQVPPIVLTTVVSGAMTSPQPGSPRRQMPFIPRSAPSARSASAATSFHVGFSGMVRPCSSKTSLRYIRKDDSP